MTDTKNTSQQDNNLSVESLVEMMLIKSDDSETADEQVTDTNEQSSDSQESPLVLEQSSNDTEEQAQTECVTDSVEVQVEVEELLDDSDVIEEDVIEEGVEEPIEKLDKEAVIVSISLAEDEDKDKDKDNSDDAVKTDDDTDVENDEPEVIVEPVTADITTDSKDASDAIEDAPFEHLSTPTQDNAMQPVRSNLDVLALDKAGVDLSQFNADDLESLDFDAIDLLVSDSGVRVIEKGAASNEKQLSKERRIKNKKEIKKKEAVSHLEDANLDSTDLKGTDLKSTDLKSTKLDDTISEDIDLQESELKEAASEEPTISEATLDDDTAETTQESSEQNTQNADKAQSESAILATEVDIDTLIEALGLDSRPQIVPKSDLTSLAIQTDYSGNLLTQENRYILKQVKSDNKVKDAVEQLKDAIEQSVSVVNKSQNTPSVEDKVLEPDTGIIVNIANNVKDDDIVTSPDVASSDVANTEVTDSEETENDSIDEINDATEPDDNLTPETMVDEGDNESIETTINTVNDVEDEAITKRCTDAFNNIDDQLRSFKQQMQEIGEQSNALHELSSKMMADLRQLQQTGANDFSITYEQMYQLQDGLLATRRAYNALPNFYDSVTQAWENDLYTAQMHPNKNKDA